MASPSAPSTESPSPELLMTSATTSCSPRSDNTEQASGEDSPNILSDPPSAKEKCSLLSLAAELRIVIWEQVVRRPTGITSCVLSQPAITATCRQARDETLLLFYETNAFSLRCKITITGSLHGPETGARYMNEVRKLRPSASSSRLILGVYLNGKTGKLDLKEVFYYPSYKFNAAEIFPERLKKLREWDAKIIVGKKLIELAAAVGAVPRRD